MYNVLVVIPSYHRKDLIIDAWRSIKSNLIDRFEGHINFRVFTYVQDASEIDRDHLQGVLSELNDNRIQVEYVPKYINGTIGTIKRDAIIKGLTRFIKLDSHNDVVLLCDDDVIIKNDQTDFVERMTKVIDHFIKNDVAVANARVSRGRKSFTISEFPSKSRKVDYVPYLERFMLLSCKPKHLKVLLGIDICQCTVGEDGYLFVKALCGGFKTFRYSGLYDFVHLQHEEKKPGFVYRGGFEDLVKESDPNGGGRNWKSHTTKYVVAARNGGNAQKLLDDFYHGEVEGEDGRRVRPDILEYISRNIRIDDYGNIVRLNGKEIYHGLDEVEESSSDSEYSQPVEIGMQ